MAITSAQIEDARTTTTIDGFEQSEVSYIVLTDTNTDVSVLKGLFRTFTATGPGTTYKGLFAATDTSQGWQGDGFVYLEKRTSVFAYIATVSYTQDPERVNTVDTSPPWEKTARFRQISRKFQASTLSDIFGDAIVNSAGDHFDPFTINKQRHHAAMILEFDTQGDPDLLALNAFLDTTNDGVFFGLPENSWLIDDLEITTKVWVDPTIGGGNAYFTQRWTFLQAIKTEEKNAAGTKVDNATWDKRYINIGFFQLKDGKYVPCTDNKGQPSTVAKLLDRNGLQIDPETVTPADSTFTDTFELFQFANFSTIPDLPLAFPL